jgi:hypothetical protein
MGLTAFVAFIMHIVYLAHICISKTSGIAREGKKR